MITPQHAQTMAVYNRWQNRSIYGAADGLSDTDRRADRGAFFKSIHGTLVHILWGDMIWMHRFAGTPAPDSPNIAASPEEIESWDDLKQVRVDFDQTIIDWTHDLSDDWLAGQLTFFSRALNREATELAWLCVTHFFNHQTHHRGQVHAMLTAAGQRPDDTDLFLMPESEQAG